jgi:hypothetical protein
MNRSFRPWEKPAYGYRRVTGWLRREEWSLREPETSVASYARAKLVGPRATPARKTKERVGREEATPPNQI